MANETFFEIAAGRYAANVLYTPELSLDLLGRDWAQLDGPWSFRLPTTSGVAPGSGTVDTLSLEMPTDWALDDSFDDLEVAVSLTIEGVVTGAGPPNGTLTVTLEDATATYTGTQLWTVAAGRVRRDVTLVFPSSAVPTGRTEIAVKYTASATATSWEVVRDWDEPDCHVWVRYV